MSYFVLKPKSKKEASFIKDLIEKLQIEYTKVSLEDYIQQIAERRKQIKQGKKVSLSSLTNGI